MERTSWYKAKVLVKRGSLGEQAITLADPEDVRLRRRRFEGLRGGGRHRRQPAGRVLLHLPAQAEVGDRRWRVRGLRRNRNGQRRGHARLPQPFVKKLGQSVTLGAFHPSPRA